MLPDWIAVAAMSLPLAAVRILLMVASTGAPFTHPTGRQLIVARVSYREIQRRCHLAPASVASGIRAAERQGLLLRTPDYPGLPDIYAVAVTMATQKVSPACPENGVGSPKNGVL
jgi:hypothetical protein